MKRNLGKEFEQNFRKSVPDSSRFYYYRIKDNTSSFYGGNDNLRFSQSNIADAFMLYTNLELNYTCLFIFEFKHHKGKSLPLNCIRENQLSEMHKASKYLGVIPMLVVFFSDVERCFALNIEQVCKFKEVEDRKSIPISFFETNGIEIKTTKLRTQFRYDILDFVNNI